VDRFAPANAPPRCEGDALEIFRKRARHALWPFAPAFDETPIAQRQVMAARRAAAS